MKIQSQGESLITLAERVTWRRHHAEGRSVTWMKITVYSHAKEGGDHTTRNGREEQDQGLQSHYIIYSHAGKDIQSHSR